MDDSAPHEMRKVGGGRQQVRHARRQSPSIHCASTSRSRRADRAGCHASRRPVMATRVERRLKKLADACRNAGNVNAGPHEAVKDYVKPRGDFRRVPSVFELSRDPLLMRPMKTTHLRRWLSLLQCCVTTATPRCRSLPPRMGRFDRPPEAMCMVGKALDRSWEFRDVGPLGFVCVRKCGHF